MAICWGWKQRTQYQSLYDVANAKGFWKSYYETEIREKYSIDTRVLDCEMYLTGSDLATSTWGDIIRIDLQYYYLESVRDYYVGGKKASKGEVASIAFKRFERCRRWCQLQFEHS